MHADRVEASLCDWTYDRWSRRGISYVRRSHSVSDPMICGWGREAHAAGLEIDRGAQQPAAAGKLRKRGDPSQPKKLGPFLVQPLSSLPDKKVSGAAAPFLSDPADTPYFSAAASRST